MSLWQEKYDKNLNSAAPLADRMRPRDLSEFHGQAQFLGEGKLLRRMLQADQLTSVIFHGPPGCGKTTLARLIASHTERHFEQANAAAVGVADVRRILDEARDRLKHERKRTIFFLDEIHRFNRAQQDVLLGDVERGVITLIGATTENPFFSVNAALVSRSQIFSFEPLNENAIIEVLRRAMSDEQRGFGTLDLSADEEALQHWAQISDGDARRALMALEVAVLSEKARDSEAPIRIDLSIAQDAIQQKAVQYDRAGDQHYDTISAFIKSVRGSDPDAALYWLAKMIVAGEDPLFICRRLAILASEDIGNADPRGLSMAADCYTIVERIGMPEGRIPMGQLTVYLACAPKSNASYLAINEAIADVRSGRTQPVPKHLRGTGYKGAEQLGSGVGYQYAHQGEKGYVEQDYLGVDKHFYQPTDRGYEKHMKAWLEGLRGNSADK